MKTLETTLQKHKHTSLGRHLLLELYHCNRKLLDQAEAVENVLKEAALAAGATIIQSNFHHFSPYGISGVVVIAESHITIHTWPEYGYAAIDVFTCDYQLDLELIEKRLVGAFLPERHEHSLIERGHLSRL